MARLEGGQMNSFDRLLSPFDVNQFFLEYWHREPLYIDGDENKFANLPGLKELPSLLAGKLTPNYWAKGHTHSAQGSFIDRAGNVRKINAVPSMWPELFNSGVSLGFSALDQYHEELKQFVQGIASATRLPGTIVTTCYLTPPFSGSPMHFDSQHVFFMQVSGKKHWKIGQRAAWQDAPTNVQLSSLETPGMKAFLESIGVVIAGPEDTGLREVTLNAGDVLYMPPGFWHEGHTSDTHSLHYTLTFMPLGPWHLLVAYLRQSLFENSSLRRDLRFVAESGEGDTTRLIETAIVELRDTVGRLTAKEVEDFFVQCDSTGGMLKNYLVQP
jgi:ribosomal protein L16 Arg81 hydroxylase